MTESSFSSLMWVQSLQICAVFAMAWLGSRLLRKRSPHIAHILWLVVLLKCVTPPLWSSSTGVFCWLRNVGTSEAKVTSVVVAPEAKHTADETVLLKPTAAETQHLPDLKPLPSHDAVPQPVFIPETRSKRGWSTWLLFAWAIGVAIASVILGVQIGRCLLLCRNGTHDPQLQQAVDALAQQVGLSRRVRVWVTASNVGPAVIGIFRPKIILPEAITKSRSIESLQPVLMHELIHIRRGDLWLGCLQTFARLFWWFHPLVHWSVRQASRSAESCCDQESLAALKCSPREYAQCLLTILEQKKQLTPIPSFPGVRAMDITSNRLEQIMKTRQGSLRTGKRLSRCVLLLSAFIVLPGAAFVASGDELQKSTGGTTTEAVFHASESDDSPERSKQAQKYLTRAYPVADLMIPVQEKATIHVAMDDNGKNEWEELMSLTASATQKPPLQQTKPANNSLNFGLLKNIIMTSVSRASWDVRGGEGAITFHLGSMSLVVYQRPTVHDDIAELFRQLRQLREMQLTHELTVVRLTHTQFNDLAINFTATENRSFVLSDATRTNWNRIESDVAANDRFSAKVTIFNEQRLALAFPGQQTIGLAHIISADRRKVRFRIRSNTKGESHTVVVDDGSQFLIDVTDSLQASAEFPLQADEYVVLSVTPRIVVIEEEEERVVPESRTISASRDAP